MGYKIDEVNQDGSTSWLWVVFDRLASCRSPFRLVKSNNPVFRWELSRLEWPTSPKSKHLTHYISSVGFVYPVVFGLLCILLVLLTPFRMFAIVDGLTLLSLGSTLLFDIYYMRVTLNLISHQVQSGHWAMLQLTPLPRREIVAAEWAIAQIRAWRMTAVEIGLRLFTGIVFIYGPMIFDVVKTPTRLSPGFFVSLGVLSLFLLGFLVESVWRMKTLTAIGLAISAQAGDAAKSGLSAFAAIIGVRMVQGAILFGVLYGFSKAIEVVMTRRDQFGVDTLLPVLLAGLGAVLVVTLMYWLFRALQQTAFRFVM